MATVHVVLCKVQGRNRRTILPVPDSVPLGAKTATSSGSSAEVDVGVKGQPGQFWSVTVTGGNIYARFGANPTAVTDEGWLILDGQTREFAVCAAGEEIAIKDA